MKKINETKNKRKEKGLKKGQKGITLVALIITIIILIILATVAINFAFGNNGLINRAEQAKDFYANDTKYTEESMTNVESYLDDIIAGTGVSGDEGEDIPPEPEIPGGAEAIESGAITFANPIWAGGKASVTISTNTNYTLQYQVVANEGASIDTNWQEVPQGGVISNLNHRDVVYARLVQDSYYGEEASTTVKDTMPPTISNISTSDITTNSITVTVTANDNETGIASYTYTINGGSQASNTTGSHTFTGLSAGTQYTIQVTVTDKVGQTVQDSTQTTTKQVTVADSKGDGTKYTNTTPIKDDLGNTVYIPGGFHIAGDSATKVEGGIVIEDDSGNQFVWIPVGTYKTSSGSKTNELSRRTFTSSGATTVSGDNAINSYYYGEGDSSSVASGQIESFKISATNHGGFYIGRYEQGSGNVCKAGVTPYVDVTRDTAKSLAESMYSGNSSIKATTQLISSYAWDTALNFICQTNTAGYTLATTTSSSYGNIGTENRQNTGAYSADKYSNIHDFLGNCFEWTTEYYSYSLYPCVYRGGYCNGSVDYAADRSNRNSTSHSNDNISFRTQLYV